MLMILLHLLVLFNIYSILLAAIIRLTLVGESMPCECNKLLFINLTIILISFFCCPDHKQFFWSDKLMTHKVDEVNQGTGNKQQ